MAATSSKATATATGSATVTATVSTPIINSPTKPHTTSKPRKVPRDCLKELVVGYPKLAGKMEIYPAVAIFRRFGALKARNLLYLQRELTHYEKELKKLELRDSQSGIGLRDQFATDGWMLFHPDKKRDGEGLARRARN